MPDRYVTAIESALSEVLENRYAPVLTESMRYGLMGGGKRIRPWLLLAVCEMLGGTVKTALPFACALEMIHSYSLVHDDLPSMDNDDMRRGKPSCHKAFCEANAILAGDGLLTAAALLLVKQVGHDEAKAAILTGAMTMVSGQSYDLNETERTERMLHLLHEQKTGALFRAAAQAGVCLAGREDLTETFSAFGDAVGLLFQITDDLLDAEKDRAENKFTYVTLFGEQASRSRLMTTEQTALSILSPYDNAPADAIRAMIRKLAERTE